MLKLPTNAGEWGFVVVLSALFCGLVFVVIYSQVQLHDMRREQARIDTESNLLVLAEHVRTHHRRHTKSETDLRAMGLHDEALETRNAVIENTVQHREGLFVLTARLIKFGEARCTLVFAIDGDAHEFRWSDSR